MGLPLAAGGDTKECGRMNSEIYLTPRQRTVSTINMVNSSAALVKARDIKAKYEATIAEAKADALAVIACHLAELSELGFKYSLIEKPARPVAPRSALWKQRLCQVCGQSGHNRRTCPQRDQGATAPAGAPESGGD